MMPVYSYMDSHPFQKNQKMSHPQYHYQYPGMETIPSHAMMDPAKSHMPHHHDSCRYGPGPSYGYGYPMPFYSCCNGGNFPSYHSFRLPHQPMHCFGEYPPYPEPYYVHHVSPPHYNMEQPRYEFDNTMLRNQNHHCCGCPNSFCKQNLKEDTSMKIEEEDPYITRKGSLFPIQFGKNQRPIVWIPPDYMESQRGREPSETDTVQARKEDDGSNLTGFSKSFDKVPKFWSGLPLAEGIRAQNVQNNPHQDMKKPLPFPIIWMPAFGGEETPNPTEEPADAKKSTPTCIIQKDDDTRESNRIEEKSIIENGPEVVKTINQTVKEINHNKTEDNMTEKETRCIPVKTLEDNVESESGTNVKEQSSSSPKKPKLPPVCLRVDPFPKKKNGNRRSRSLSPPKESTSSTMENNSEKESKINVGTLIGSTPLEPNREKVVKLEEVKLHENLKSNQGDDENIPSTEDSVSSPKNAREKFPEQVFKEEVREESASREYGEKDITQNGDASIEKAVEERLDKSSDGLVGDEIKIEKINLSDVEAAVLIQSAYRGYEVRKWELLKKLRQIAEIRQQVTEVRNCVEALESAPQDEKQRMLIGETIMRLLLKLDTIQGLHSSVREIRKSLAKELVALQERLDCIMMDKPTELAKEVLMDKFVEDCNIESHDDKTEQEQNKNELTEIGETLSVEAHGAETLCGVDEGSLKDMESTAKNELEGLAGDGFKESQEINAENIKVSEAEKLAEHKESGFQNEDTSDFSPQNSSHQLSENEQVLALEMEGEKPEESESGGEMEPNVKLTDAEKRIGEIPQAGTKEETPNELASSCEVEPFAEDSYEVPALNLIFDNDVEAVEAELTQGVQDKISTPALKENGKIENMTAAEKELLITEVDDRTDSFEADMLEQIEMREDVLLCEDRIPNDKQLQEQAGYHEEIGTEQHDECLNYSMNEVENKEVPDESADLPPELSYYADYRNTKNEKSTEENEQQTVDKLDKQEHKSDTVEISIETGAELKPFSQDRIQESVDKNDLVRNDTEMDKKLVEENLKMRKMVEKLMEAGKEQLTVISKLNGRVRNLEKRLAKKKKLRRGCYRSTARSPMLNRRLMA